MRWLEAWNALIAPRLRKSSAVPDDERGARRVTPCDTAEAALRKRARSGR